MRYISWLGVLAVLGLALGGCANDGSGSSDPAGSMKGGSNGTTQIHVRLQLPNTTDVAGIFFTVSCNDGTTASEYVPLEDEGLPGFIGGGAAGQLFADFFQVLPGNAICDVVATPMQSPDLPSAHCQPASTTITVVPNVTTEVVLGIQCSSGNGTGAIDVVTTLNQPPVITNLDLAPSKFILACQYGTIAVTAVDPDGDPLTYTWEVVSAPFGAIYDLSPNGPVLNFAAETPGTYMITVTVSDGKGGTATLTFPIHVSFNPDCEHLFEVCCKYGDGFYASVHPDECEALGGLAVDVLECKQEVCCKTALGPAIVSAAQCAPDNVLPDAMCVKQVCCRTENADGVSFSIVGQSQCVKPSTIVPDNQCKQVCCKSAATTLPVNTTFGECLANGGAVVPDEQCAEIVCCRREDGTVALLPSEQCLAVTVVGVPGGTIVPLDHCKEVVCCEIQPGAVPQWINALQCLQANGIVKPATECGPQSINLNLDLQPQQGEPCEPPPRLVVPSSGNHKLAVFDTDTLAALPGSPFDTCSSPSRISFDWNLDIIATCRGNAPQVQKHAIGGAVIWTTSLPGCDWGARGVTISPDGRLWVGCTSPGTIYQLNHATGAIVQTIPLVPAPGYQNPQVYGLMSDADGIYVADLFGGGMSKISLATNAVVWAVPMNVYGISVDGMGHIWAGGGGGLKKVRTSDGVVLNVFPYPAGVTYTGGVQVSPDLYVYGAAQASPGLLVKFDLATEMWDPIEPTLALAGGSATWGVTAEFDGDVYAMNLGSSNITKFPAGANGATAVGAQNFTVAGLSNPYGYSGDMTGLALCANTNTFEWLSGPITTTPPSATTQWGVLTWTQITPPGSGIIMYYRIDGGAWTAINNGDNIGQSGTVLELKAVFTWPNAGVAPTLGNVNVQYTP